MTFVESSVANPNFMVIGVTGGICCGKSTVSKHLVGEYGYELFDADAMVHSYMENDKGMIQAIGKEFPECKVPIPGRGGHKPGEPVAEHIDRAILSRIILGGSSEEEKRAKLIKLEEVLHPYIERMARYVIDNAHENGRAGVILDVPLLFESAMDELCDRVIVVHASPEDVKNRLEKRRREAKDKGKEAMTDEMFELLTSRQLAHHNRLALADADFDTSGPSETGKIRTQAAVDGVMSEWGVRRAGNRENQL